MNRDALVVGINTYHWDGFTNLPSPAADAEAIAQCLEQYGEFRVRQRLPEYLDPFDSNAHRVAWNQDVTTKNLEDALIQLFKPNGQHIPETALFFFSGHGIRKERGVTEGYLATSETNPEQENWGLRLGWLRELLQTSPVRQQIVWLDCCYSGEALNFRETDPGIQRDRQSLFLIAAARDFEAAGVEIGQVHSIFTAALLEGLNPNRQPTGVVTNDLLIESIKRRLNREIQQPLWINPDREILLTGKRREPLTLNLEGVCPYRGLQPFDEEHAVYFYGRGELTTQLLKRVQIAQGNFVAVVGASGSGKSSVVQAGLIHRLKQGFKHSRSDEWQIRSMTPKEKPLASLAEIFLDPRLTDIERADQLRKAEAAIAEGPSGLARLIEVSDAPRTVLFVDQFEEVFTLCQNLSERQQFLACLLGALEQTGNKLCLVIAMRADFMGKCTEYDYSGLAKQIQDRLVLVEPMKAEELEQAIRGPAKQVGLRIDDHLIQQILADLSIEEQPMAQEATTIDRNWEPGSLPLLEYTLEQLWQRRTLDRLTLDSYIELGGVRQALENRADSIYQSFTSDEQLITKHIFLALTYLGEGTEDTRRRIFKQDLITPQQPQILVEGVIQKLTEARLIVTSQVNFKGTEPQSGEVIDIAHEALIRYWQRLRQWVSGNREAIRTARKLETSAQEWKSHHKHNDYLLLGNRLAEAELFLEKHGDLGLLSQLTQDFVYTSQKERDRLKQEKEARRQHELEQEREAARAARKAARAARKAAKAERIRTIAIFVGALAVVGAIGFGWQKRQQLQKNTLDIWAGVESIDSEVLESAEKSAQKYEQAQKIDNALAYYRQIRATTVASLAKSIPKPEDLQALLTTYEELSQPLQKRLDNQPVDELLKLSKSAEHQIFELIKNYRLQPLIDNLNNNSFGSLKPDAEDLDGEERYEEGALKKTYSILMQNTGAGADLNGNGRLDTHHEALQIPCPILIEIERLWQLKGCSWYESDPYDPRSSNCKDFDQRALAILIFPRSDSYFVAVERIEACRSTPKHKTSNVSLDPQSYHQVLGKTEP